MGLIGERLDQDAATVVAAMLEASRGFEREVGATRAEDQVKLQRVTGVR